MRALEILVFAALAAGNAAAQEPLLEGHTLLVANQIQLAPDYFRSFSSSIVVGPGVEVTGFGLNDYLQLDFSDRQVVITALASHSAGYGEHIGFLDSEHSIHEFVVVTATGSWAGFNAANMWINAEDVTVNISPFGTVAAGSTIVLTLNPIPASSAVFCVPGEAGVADCPCLPPFTIPRRPHAPASGCPNSFQRGGARLEAFGNPVHIDMSDKLVLFATGLPNTLTLFVEGDAALPAGQPFGDGVSCFGGTELRFGVQFATNGAARYPPRTGGQPIAGITHPPAGSTRYYQALYRNARANWCSPPTFNVSNGVSIVWP